MMRLLLTVAAILVASCGRLSFDPVVADDTDGGVDNPGSDASAADPCDEPEAIICETFEGQWAAAWSDDTAGGGSVTIDARAHTGSGALLAALPGAGIARLSQPLPSALTSGILYVRMWMQVQPGPQLTDWVVLIEVAGATGDKISFDGNFDDRVGLHSAPAAEYRNSAASDLPRDRWFCVELYTEIDDIIGVARVSIDGTELLAIDGFDTRPADGMTNSFVGPVASSDGIEVLIDDVYIGRRAVGCQ